MVGLLSGMDNEDRSSVAQEDKDVSVGAVQQESNVHKSSADESQPAAGNTDNVDEVEHVKELKSILKRRGQYTFRKVKVDFDPIPKKIPFDENDYTVEIKIIEKEPIKIKSWAAIFAAKKAEAEAEAAAIAEAEEALKKAEEVQKREALKKANKAKLKKSKEHESSEEIRASSPREQNGDVSASCNISPQEPTLEHIEPESSHPSVDDSSPSTETKENQTWEESNETHKVEVTSALSKQCVPSVDYQLAECIVEEILDAVIIPEDLLNQDMKLESKEIESHSEQNEEEESSCIDSLVAERSENQQEEHTNEDLDEISTLEEASVSQLEDPNTEGSSCYDACHSDASHSSSNLEQKSSDEGASESHSEDSSSKLVELQGKQVPKKVLVTAESLVEEILSEMPEVIQFEPKDSSTVISALKEKSEIKISLQNDVAPGLPDSNLANDSKNKTRDLNLESGARRKRREFKKSNDSKIFEHVKRSLESAAPEILETAVGVLDEIEKIVVEKVGSAIS